jgi:ABC transport system ATP-binding/permease protein
MTATSAATRLHGATAAFPASPSAGARVDAIDITQHAGLRQLLQPLSIALQPGEFVAIVGGSGAGKTTLLRTLAGLQEPSAGVILHDGRRPLDRTASTSGYVPQEDIIHGDLPLLRTLHYAARLRLPHGTSSAEVDTVVRTTLERLDLASRADVRVRDLSGGQRKRASIAVELLVQPRFFALDEPTSGLDPASAAEVMDVLRGFANSGTTVVLTTHSPEDLAACDRVIFLARDGHLVFDGAPAEALDYFEVERLSQAYTRVDREATPELWAARFMKNRATPEPVSSPALPLEAPAPRRLFGLLGQWATLTRRDAELLLHNRLTLAIILGSPLLVTLMMTTLFQSGAADATNPFQSVNLAFWLAFDGFFFGLTYGLLQVVTEFPIFTRERRSGVTVPGYVAAKVAVLLPILLAIDVVMLTALRLTGRLPAAGLEVYLPLAAIFLLVALAGLACGLLASSVVRHPAQAALALPMICFPQVLFGGAIVPVSQMTVLGYGLSFGMATRWGFEAIARVLGVGEGAALAGPGAPDYSATVSGAALPGVAALLVMFAALTAATVFALSRRSHTH